MKKLNHLLVFIILVIQSCNTIKREDLTVIEGLKIGVNMTAYNKQLDSLNIPKKAMYPQYYVGDEVAKNGMFQCYTTEMFNNLPELKSPTIKHWGLLVPLVYSASENLVGLQILLSHAAYASFLTSQSRSLYGDKGRYGINQTVSQELVNAVTKMLTVKYGNPADTIRSENTNFMAITNNEFIEYKSPAIKIGEMLVWKTPYMTISFFKGLPSYRISYDTAWKTYATSFKPGYTIFYNPEAGQSPCYEFTYIKYELNEKTIKALGLDKSKL